MSDPKKLDCKYGEKCYQKNPAHLEKYNHPKKGKAQLETTESAQKRNASTREENDSKRRKKSPSPFKLHKALSRSRSSSPQKRSSRSRSESPQSKDSSLGEAKESKSRKKSPSPYLMVKKHRTRSQSKSPQGRRSKSRSKSPRKANSPGKQKVTSPKAGGSEEKPDNSEKKAKSKSPERKDNLERLREIAERKEMDITKEYKEVMRNLSKSNYFEVFQRRVRYSKKAEYQDLLKTTDFIRHKFLVEMPPDFFKLWEFCETLAKQDQKPETVFEKFGLKLVGPFDYLAGKFHNAEVREPGDYLRHWRFYYDPPEFQTIFVMGGTEVHYGYWRDDPQDKDNLLVARNDSEKGFEIDFIGGNCFQAVKYFLETDVVFTPFNRAEITTLKKRLQKFAEENNIPLNNLEQLKKVRDAKVVCKTFHQAGLVVPQNRKTGVGYRNLIESDANLKKIIAKIGHALGDKGVIAAAMEQLQPIITAANIAVDECDFGTAVELGIDLFCGGVPELHEVINQLLVTGYSMLKRPQFIAISKAHLENRRRGHDLDMLK